MFKRERIKEMQAELRDYFVKGFDSYNMLANKIGVTWNTLDGFLNTRRSPHAGTLLLIDRFLKKVKRDI